MDQTTNKMHLVMSEKHPKEKLYERNIISPFPLVDMPRFMG